MKQKVKYLTQFLFYDLFSLISFILDLFIVWILTNIFKIHYLISVSIGLVVAVMFLYIAGRKSIYKKTKQSLKKGYIISLIISLLSLFLILILMTLLVEKIKMNYLLARILSGGIVGIIDYFADTHFSFKMRCLPKRIFR
jgi:putative flippase GtrA